MIFFLFQIRVVVFDNGFFSRLVIVIVYVIVRRNFFVFIWIQFSFLGNVLEIQFLGVSILQVIVIDVDLQVILFLSFIVMIISN